MPTDDPLQHYFAIETAMQTWRSQYGTEPGGRDPDSPSASAPLYAAINDAAEAFGVVGGAFGVINNNTKRFELWRHIPPLNESGEEPKLFPYLLPNTDIREIDRFLPESQDRKATYSKWMHALFEVYRKEQGINQESADNISMPEFFRSFSSDGSAVQFVCDHTAISKILSKWAVLWGFAALDAYGLGYHGDPPMTELRSEAIEAISMYGVFEAAVANTRAQSPSTAEILNELPEYRMFGGESDPDVTKALVQLTRNTSWGRIVQMIGTDPPLDYLSSFRPNADFSPFQELLELHQNAPFPLLPYLMLRLADSRALSHIVLPIWRSDEFKTEGIDSDGNKFFSPWVVVFVASVAQSSLEQRREFPQHPQFGSLRMLMRLAAQPLVDRVFYGGIAKTMVATKTRADVTKDARHVLGHQVKDLGLAFNRWLVDVDRWKDAEEHYSHARDSALLDAYQIAPVPSLFQDAGRLLTLWNLSNRAADLYDGDLPSTLEDIVLASWELAKKCDFVVFHATKCNFRADLDSIKRSAQGGDYCDADLQPRELGTVRVLHLESAGAHDRAIVDRRISGLTRVLTVAFENFLRHCRENRATPPMTVFVERDYSNGGEAFAVVVSNPKIASKGTSVAKAGPVKLQAFKGNDIISYLCENSIEGGSPTFQDLRDRYTLKIPVPTRSPQWLEEVS